MFHTDSWDVVKHLGAGNVGLEKEGLRVTGDGFMAQTRDPFIGNPNIVKDFSENQTEINTPVCSSTKEAVDYLAKYAALIRKTIGRCLSLSSCGLFPIRRISGTSRRSRWRNMRETNGSKQSTETTLLSAMGSI